MSQVEPEPEPEFRGILPGTKSSSFYSWRKPGMRVTDFPTVQSYIEYITDMFMDSIDPTSKIQPEIPASLYAVPSPIQQQTWLYYNMRHFVMEIGQLAGELDTICTIQTCPKMKATNEWQFLCSSHPKATECCAIDYTTHTIEAILSLLDSRQLFPNRDVISTKSNDTFNSMARRLYRIFAHVYFNHRNVYDEFESRTRLCDRYTAFCRQFSLVPEDNFKEELEKRKGPSSTTSSTSSGSSFPSIHSKRHR